MIAFSGGNLFPGDRLTKLDPSRLQILRKVTPSLGEAAVPVGLFEHDVQYAFVLPVERPFGRRTLFAVFNPSLKLVDRHLIRGHVRFDAGEKVRWVVGYGEFEGKG